MLYYFVATIYVLVCFLLLIVVLLQQGKGGDMASAFGGGGSQTAFGARQGATVLSKATAILGALFMARRDRARLPRQQGQLAARRHRRSGAAGRDADRPDAGPGDARRRSAGLRARPSRPRRRPAGSRHATGHAGAGRSAEAEAVAVERG